jgi:uncharacterized protein YjaZ
LLAVALAVLAFADACRRTEGIRTVFVGDHDFTLAERRTITRIAGDTAREARQVLPGLAPTITVRAQSGTRVIAELGAIGEVAPPDYVVWTVDVSRPEGVTKIAEAYLRVALLHEFHHLVRLTAQPGNTVMDQVISEGMATVFERDFGKWMSPWSQYPETAASWVTDLLAQPSEEQRSTWLSQHPDRRVRYKAGAYIIDRVMKKTGKTAADLVTLPTAEILSAAGLP